MVIGNLGGDPELRYLLSGQPAVGFSIATDESFTDKQGEKQERVEWHHIVAFGKLAETCNQYLKKGRQVYVEGRLRTREFEARKKRRHEAAHRDRRCSHSVSRASPRGKERGERD